MMTTIRLLSGVAAAALRWIGRGGKCTWCRGTGKLILMTSVVDCDCRRPGPCLPGGTGRFAAGERVWLVASRFPSVRGPGGTAPGTVLEAADTGHVVVRWNELPGGLGVYDASELRRAAPPRPGLFAVGDRVRPLYRRYEGTVVVSGVGRVVVRWDDGGGTASAYDPQELSRVAT